MIKRYNRRQFITNGCVRLGVVLVASGGIFNSSCSNNENGTPAERDKIILFLNELGNIIIPPGEVPGAKDADVGLYISKIVADCYSDEDQIKYYEDIESINTTCFNKFGKKFLDCTQKQKHELVADMEIKHNGYMNIKSKIVSAYLTSEIGMTKFFKYHMVPGYYDGYATSPSWI